MAIDDRLDLRRNDLSLTYRPQREWIEGRGLLLVIAHFFSAAGAGAWIFAAWFDVRAAQIMALVTIAILSGWAHIFFLGRWSRFWRMARRPHRSWISRGLWSMGIYMTGAVGFLLLPDGLLGDLLLAISLVGAGLILLYEGFVYSASVGIPFWRTVMLPLLSVAYGLRGGAAVLLMFAALGEGTFDIDAVEVVKLWVVLSTAVLVAIYLAAAGRAGGAARESMRQLVSGRISPAFYGGTIAVGIVVPLVLGAASLVGGSALVLLGLIGGASLIGDFYVRYSIVKAGLYVPLHGAGIPAPGEHN
ncbi:MAG TPA: NrfD/PsrC family molybdoenzyme membrane anchor subunit [Dehalococcoidia bacterium]|jgi:formate-dependent nitrite reductase membrane component NrfD|nr:NrfD/PsrC family molybdoenzyme membrane anchor subunit [Dehalococcoidia bacterium]